MSHIPSSFIKNIALEIHDSYNLDDAPFPPDGRNATEIPLLGRNQLTAKFLSFLNSPSRKGVFLVTGYRGMGKTSFVNHVLFLYRQSFKKRKDRKRLKVIHLTIAQNQPKEIDLLRLIVMSVFDEYKAFLSKHLFYSIYFWSFGRYLINLALMSSVLSLSTLFIWKDVAINSFLDNHLRLTNCFFEKHVNFYTDSVIISLFLILSAATIIYIGIYILVQKDSAFNRIRWLVERCYSSLSEENNDNKEAGVGFPIINIKLFRGEKRTKSYPVASTKELEYELQNFLKKAKKRHSLSFIFVFDELDKLDPPVSTTYLYDESEAFEKQKVENAYERELRERKQAILNIITGLKNFFTTAPARFIFIAGREMFDASLADISDRQSPISSIFTYIFNIESLLKEKEFLQKYEFQNPSSLSYGIELYLKMLLFGSVQATEQSNSLYDLAKQKYIDEMDKPNEDFDKLYFILQNYVTFLTYRTNGSPKKIRKEIHEFIKVQPIGTELNELFPHGQTMVFGQRHNRKRFYLFFNYDNQYRIGFINNLYRPFLIKYGRSFKLFSDNIIVSTPYLFDHLLKFHPFAFSMSNLELVPEVLSTDKTPSLREHIRQIINYLSGTHIREIEIGLFDYKFYSRTLNEITFLSKIFEQESAALNYTLDESYLVKLHVRNKIRELRNTFAQFLDTADNNRQISSIAHLNGILGDLHFFDQEYSEAIIAYEDAIRPLSGMKMYNVITQDFITLLRNRLKTGLCFEKINSYESALANYSDNADDAFRFMIFRLKKGAPWMKAKQYDLKYSEKLFGAEETINYYSSPLSDLLQVVFQSFMAQVYLQEKRSVAGVSELKVCMALGSFLGITTRFFRHVTRNHIIKANAFLHTGNLLYFKNSEQAIDIDISYESILPLPFRENLSRLVKWNKPPNTENRRPILAFYMYLMGMNEMFEYRQRKDFFDLFVVGKNPIPQLLSELQDSLRAEEDYRGIYFNYVSSLLSNIGDHLLSNQLNLDTQDTHKMLIEDIFDKKTWCASKESIENNQSGATDEFSFVNFLAGPKDSDNNFRIQDVLGCYYLAAKYLVKQGKVTGAGFQYRKILYTLRVILDKGTLKEQQLELFYRFINKTLIMPMLDWANQSTGYGESHMHNKASKLKVQDIYIDQNLSNHAEKREIMLLFYYIKLKTGSRNIPDIKFIVSSQNSFSAQFARLQELEFYSMYLRTTEQATGVVMDKTKSIDYLYSLLSVLQIMDIYGSDYWMGYSFLAYSHIKVAMYLELLISSKTNMSEIERELYQLLGTGSYSSLDIIAHYLKAAELYEKALRLHNAGDEYKQTISDMIYLEDDFNDSAYHFGAALDRYLINSGEFKRSLNYCRDKINYNREEHELRQRGLQLKLVEYVPKRFVYKI